MEDLGLSRYWKQRSVFVTGAAGLVGGWLCEELVRRGAAVTAYVRDWVPGSRLHHEGLDRKVNVVRGELEDFQTLERALNEYESETVFHLAAQTIVGTANRNPLSTFESNIKGTWNLMEACRRVPTVRRIVVASSDKAYGDQPVLPYTEETPLTGRHPYDVSKSCADLIAASYHHTYKMPVCVTRCGNFYGGGDLNFNRIVPGTIRSVLNDEAPVIRSDGKLVRDYFFVEDGVEAYLHLAEKMDAPEIHGEAFNFSNEIQMTVIDLVQAILKEMGREDLKPIILNQASNEILHQYLSAEKARRLLGWSPRYTIEEGLEKTIAWYEDYLKSPRRELV